MRKQKHFMNSEKNLIKIKSGFKSFFSNVSEAVSGSEQDYTEGKDNTDYHGVVYIKLPYKPVLTVVKYLIIQFSTIFSKVLYNAPVSFSFQSLNFRCKGWP